MAAQYRTLGFVLKKEDLREADKSFTVYTEDFGKLEILGKAIRKIKSKLRSGMELFYFSEIEFIQGKAHKTLTDAIAIEKFKNIRQDLKRMEIARKIAGATEELIKGQERDREIWDLLNEVFEKLNNLSSVIGNLSLLYHYFFWNLLSILGYQVDLYHCVKCQEKLNSGIMNFSWESNGIICLRCSDDRIKDKILIAPEAIKILRIFLKKDWKTLSRLKITDSHKKSLENISEDYLSYY